MRTEFGILADRQLMQSAVDSMRKSLSDCGATPLTEDECRTEILNSLKREKRKRGLADHFESVADYFKAGNPEATTFRLGQPWVERKSFSKSKREKIHRENGGCCQVCGLTNELEVEHRRGLQNGGGNERDNLGTLCHDCHAKKTAMDKSLRRQRDKLLEQKWREAAE